MLALFVVYDIFHRFTTTLPIFSFMCFSWFFFWYPKLCQGHVFVVLLEAEIFVNLSSFFVELRTIPSPHAEKYSQYHNSNHSAASTENEQLPSREQSRSRVRYQDDTPRKERPENGRYDDYLPFSTNGNCSKKLFRSYILRRENWFVDNI